MKATDLSPFAEEKYEVNVIVETPKGSGNKFNYDPKSGLYELGSPMPEGFTFPFEFGFIPSTLGDDGDPLDVLILMESPTFAGCHVKARLLGVIEAVQTEKDGKKERNDRLIAVPAKSQVNREITNVKNLPSALMWEIENFFKSYNRIRGKKFTVLACHGPKRGMELVKKAHKKAGRKRRK